jgi:hypothetical protein
MKRMERRAPMSSTESGKPKEGIPTGLPEVDRLAVLPSCSIQDYIAGVSSYVRRHSELGAGPKKAAQIRLSSSLARALAFDLGRHVPGLGERLVTQEQKIAGGLRVANADVSESHSLDGLRIAVELKPINLAVGRAIWNRFGDIRTFAVNIHLKFPFAVVGGVLVVPTYEEVGTRAAKKALAAEDQAAAATTETEVERIQEVSSDSSADAPQTASSKKSTVHLIRRAIDRLIRAGGRRSEADAPHLLEGIAVVAYDPETGQIDQAVPAIGTGLRWEDFVEVLAKAYLARFED